MRELGKVGDGKQAGGCNSRKRFRWWAGGAVVSVNPEGVDS